MNAEEIMKTLEEKGAVLRGHFLLSSGRHSDVFAQKFRVLEDPNIAKSFGESLARAFAGGFDVVVSPAVGAIVLGFATALAGGARFVFTEWEGDAMTLRRGFSVDEGERVLVVEDVITTGGSAREVVDLVAAKGAKVIGVGALVDRVDPARGDLGAPLKALATLPSRSWDPEDCPLCTSGEPLDDPGSRRLG